MITEEIREILLDLQDENYRIFQSRLIPSLPPYAMIGIRTPVLRRYARLLMNRNDITEFLCSVPHRYFDENQLHAFILSEITDFDSCMNEVNRFLPYVDNWATCDQMSPKIFKNHKIQLLEQITVWMQSAQPYTVRFALGMLMKHFMDEDFDARYLDMAKAVRSDEYYVNMMRAWFFAEALAKQYDAALPFLEKRLLDVWTHNKTIQKAVESRQICADQKEYLKSLKIKNQ